MKAKLFLSFSVLLLCSLLISCEVLENLSLNSPTHAVNQFMHALNSDNPSKALDQICESMVIPSLPEKTLKDLDYEEKYSDEETAQVRVTGEIRLEDPDLGALKKNLDFVLVLEKDGKDWCIQRESLISIFDSIIDLSY